MWGSWGAARAGCPCPWGELGWGRPGELGAVLVWDVGLFPTGWLPLAPQPLLGAATHFLALELIKSE